MPRRTAKTKVRKALWIETPGGIVKVTPDDPKYKHYVEVYKNGIKRGSNKVSVD